MLFLHFLISSNSETHRKTRNVNSLVWGQGVSGGYFSTVPGRIHYSLTLQSTFPFRGCSNMRFAPQRSCVIFAGNGNTVIALLVDSPGEAGRAPTYPPASPSARGWKRSTLRVTSVRRRSSRARGGARGADMRRAYGRQDALARRPSGGAHLPNGGHRGRGRALLRVCVPQWRVTGARELLVAPCVVLRRAGQRASAPEVLLSPHRGAARDASGGALGVGLAPATLPWPAARVEPPKTSLWRWTSGRSRGPCRRAPPRRPGWSGCRRLRVPETALSAPRVGATGRRHGCPLSVRWRAPTPVGLRKGGTGLLGCFPHPKFSRRE